MSHRLTLADHSITMKKLSFNILSFSHPAEELTFHFSQSNQENFLRIRSAIAPNEVKNYFADHEYVYTSFDQPFQGALAITRKTTPPPKGSMVDSRSHQEDFFKPSILRRFYNQRIQNYFKTHGFIVKSGSSLSAEIWKPVTDSNIAFDTYEKYTVKTRLAPTSGSPELVVSFSGKTEVLQVPISKLLSKVPPKAFEWVVYAASLYKYDKLPDIARRNMDDVFPVVNSSIRGRIKGTKRFRFVENRYLNTHNKLSSFIREHLDREDFKKLIPLISSEFVRARSADIGKVSKKNHLLIFGGHRNHQVPFQGLNQNGPCNLPENNKIYFFFIVHKSHLNKAKQLMRFFDEGLRGNKYQFKSIRDFAKVQYYFVQQLNVVFEDLENPLRQIKKQLTSSSFEDDVRYMAIYVSPFEKQKVSTQKRRIYYQLKELLLKKKIISQVVDATRIKNTESYVPTLNNIAVAILAKLDGEPWRLNRQLKNELIIGIGAFRHEETNLTYVGSAVCFQNSGHCHQLDCSPAYQTDVLIGSVLQSIKDFQAYNAEVKRVIIHLYKNLSKKELAPIEQALRSLKLDTPIFIVKITKSKPTDIQVFDNGWKGLMPVSGTFVKVKSNKYLLFNNTRYRKNRFSPANGYPLPVKLHLYSRDKALINDTKTVKMLIDQVYQLSRLYWKSVQHQSLPITVKYPEMIAEMFPYFEGNEIPDFGKDKLWFL